MYIESGLHKYTNFLKIVIMARYLANRRNALAKSTDCRHKEPHDEENPSALRSASPPSAPPPSPPDTSLKAVKDKGKFVLGLDDAFPPMGYRDDNNEIVGYDIDLAKEAAKRLGVQLVLQPIDWNAKEQELNTGKIDCIWNGFTITPDREQAMSFTKPYLKNAQVVVVKKDSGYKTLASLKGKKVGLQAGSSAADALESAKDFKASLKQVVEFKDNLTALMDLEVKGVDARGHGTSSWRTTTSSARARPTPCCLSPSPPRTTGSASARATSASATPCRPPSSPWPKDGTAATITKKWFGSDISVIGK